MTNMFYVYVLESITDGSWYIGYTDNLRRRFAEHLRGESITTARKPEWRVVYYEAYLNQKDALGREVFLKSGSGRKFLKNQLKNHLAKVPA